MHGAEIREHQKKLKPTDPLFWMMEMAAQVEGMKRTIQELSRKLTKIEHLPNERVRKSNSRQYYALEYVPTYPAQLDWVGRTKPRDGHYDHVIIADSLIDAKNKLQDKLNAERKPTSEEQSPTEGEPQEPAA